jgi:hypothetical protein
MKPYDQITIRLQHPGTSRRKPRSGSPENTHTEDAELNWGDMLANARLRPGIYVGAPLDAHLEALRGALDFVVVARPFRQPLSVQLVCSPTQYLVRCSAGLLLKRIERSVNWNSDRMLADLLGDPYFYRTGGSCTLQATHPLPLAERFFVGIASKSGFRHQTYREGWPTTDVLFLERNSPFSFVIAGQLTSQWFTGLPFTLPDVEAIIAEYPSVHVTCEMRSSDDILPENVDSMEELCY